MNTGLRPHAAGLGWAPALALAAGILLGAPARADEPVTATAQEVVALVDALSTEDGLAAAQAEERLVAWGRAAAPALCEALKRKDPLRRRRAADLLGRVGCTELAVIDALRAAFRDTGDDDAFKLNLARALCRLGSKDGVSPLIELLQSPDRAVRLRAFIALRRYTGQDFGFRHDAGDDERKRAFRAFRAFWAAERERFQLLEPPSGE